nr:uncharacterized protein LOC109176414 [Ipomoea trifida]
MSLPHKTITSCNARWIGWSLLNIGWVKLKTIGARIEKQAEIWGLREGLRLVTEKSWNMVMIELDSEVVIKITTLGDSPTKDNVGIMIVDCKKMIDNMGTMRR